LDIGHYLSGVGVALWMFTGASSMYERRHYVVRSLKEKMGKAAQLRDVSKKYRFITFKCMPVFRQPIGHSC
jgi:hypothetical protein